MAQIASGARASVTIDTSGAGPVRGRTQADDVTMTGNALVGVDLDLGGGHDVLRLLGGTNVFRRVHNTELLLGSGVADSLSIDVMDGGVVDLGAGHDTLTLHGNVTTRVRNVERMLATGWGSQILTVDTPGAIEADLGGGYDHLAIDGRAGGAYALDLRRVEKVSETTSGAVTVTLAGALDIPTDFHLGGTDTLVLGAAVQTVGDLRVGRAVGTSGDDLLTAKAVVGAVDLGGGNDRVVMTATSRATLVGVERVEARGLDFTQDITLSGVSSAEVNLRGGRDTLRLTDAGTFTVHNVEVVRASGGGDQTILLETGGKEETVVDLGQGAGDVVSVGARLTALALSGVETLTETGAGAREVLLTARVTNGMRVALGADDTLRLSPGEHVFGDVAVGRLLGSGASDRVAARSVATPAAIDLGVGVDILDMRGGGLFRTVNVEGFVGGADDQTVRFEDAGSAVVRSFSLGGGNDTVLVGGAGSHRLSLLGVESLVNASLAPASLSLVGPGDGAAAISGFDTVRLSAGRTAVKSVAGASSIVGTADDDVLVVEAVHSALVDLGAGNDRYVAREATAVRLANVESAWVNGGGDDTVVVETASLRSLNLGDGLDHATFAVGLGTVRLTLEGVEAVRVGAGTTLVARGLTDAPVVLGAGDHDLLALFPGAFSAWA